MGWQPIFSILFCRTAAKNHRSALCYIQEIKKKNRVKKIEKEQEGRRKSKKEKDREEGIVRNKKRKSESEKDNEREKEGKRKIHFA
jgi:hypothetical protein